MYKKKSSRIYTSMHSGGFEFTKLTNTRLEDNLIRHRGDRHYAPMLNQACCILVVRNVVGDNGIYREIDASRGDNETTTNKNGWNGAENLPLHYSTN